MSRSSSVFTEMRSYCLVVLIWYPLIIPFSLPGIGGLHTRRALSAVTSKVWGLVGPLDGAERGGNVCGYKQLSGKLPDNT